MRCFKSLLCCVMTLCGFSLYAQNYDNEPYYPYESLHSEPEPLMIRTDSSLFYRAISLTPQLYGSLSRSSVSFVAFNRRGESRFDEPLRMGRLNLDYSTYSLLSRLLEEQDYLSLAPWLNASNNDSHRLTLALTDRGYRSSIGYRHQLLTRRGWTSSLYAGARFGRDGAVAAVGTDKVEGACLLQREFDNGLSLSLMATFTASKQMLASSSVEETYSLTGNNLYNPAWGFDSGKVRSSRESSRLLPVISLGLEKRVGKGSIIRFDVLSEVAIRRLSSLAWFDTSSPMPDYYRKLPSYYSDPKVRQIVEESWRNGDTRYTQIDWQELRLQNRMAGGEAKYIVQDDVTRQLNLALVLSGSSQLSTNLMIDYGLRAIIRRERNFLCVVDMLDAKYHTDIDFYLLDEGSFSHNTQNNLLSPNRQVTEGDRFGFDYSLFDSSLSLFSSIDYSFGGLRMAAELELTRSDMFRRGYYEKELFAGDGSYGRSDVQSLYPYRLNLLAGYTFKPNHHLSLSLELEGRAPQIDNLFMQPEYNNRCYEGELESRVSSQLRFVGSSGKVRYELMAFVNLVRNAMQSIRCYDDVSYTFCDRLTQNISTLSYGVEAALSARLHKRLQLSATASLLRATYVDNPVVTLYDDADNTLLSDSSPSYMRGLHLGATPHLSATVGLDYFARSWGVGIDCAYVGFRYSTPNFSRRTARVVGLLSSPEEREEFMEQGRLNDALRFDLSAWKRFRLGKKYALTLFLSLRNLLSDNDTEYDAYESHRIVRQRYGESYAFRPQGDRLSYSYPRSIYFSVGFKF